MSVTSEKATTARFIFVICQHGAETAVKQEVMGNHPNLRLAFSRPGFLTFKIDPDNPLPERFSLRSTLARTYGWTIGKVEGTDAGALVDQIRGQVSPTDWERFHVWQRDLALPGSRGFEPGATPLAEDIGRLLEDHLSSRGKKLIPNQVAKPDEKVFDLILVEPNQWWFGFHFAGTVAGRWPGGVPPVTLPDEIVNRAYLKAFESVAWSGITIQPGDVCAEIGSAPGGCCQFLLDQGAAVIGIDPAEMDATVLEHKDFRHIRKRGHEVKKKEFKDVRWLFADINIVPNYTLDTIADIVTHQSVDLKGLILTMKLTDWKLVADIPQLIARVREMGFSVVKTRQLAFNRREFCLAAVKDKFVLRIGKKGTKTKQNAQASSTSSGESPD